MVDEVVDQPLRGVTELRREGEGSELILRTVLVNRDERGGFFGVELGGVLEVLSA